MLHYVQNVQQLLTLSACHLVLERVLEREYTVGFYNFLAEEKAGSALIETK